MSKDFKTVIKYFSDYSHVQTPDGNCLRSTENIDLLQVYSRTSSVTTLIQQDINSNLFVPKVQDNDSGKFNDPYTALPLSDMPSTFTTQTTGISDDSPYIDCNQLNTFTRIPSNQSLIREESSEEDLELVIAPIDFGFDEIIPNENHLRESTPTQEFNIRVELDGDSMQIIDTKSGINIFI